MAKVPLLLLALVAPVLALGDEPKILVSSFSTVLTEIAEQVGGDRVEVVAHVKPGVDPHEFEPKPTDLKTVAQAQVILFSAKHMESYAPKLKESAGANARMVEVGASLASLASSGDRANDDPHWWHSIVNMRKATEIVRDAFSKVSQSDTEKFQTNAAKYLARLDVLAKWTRNKVAELPRDRRKLVTSHDAFQWFAKENGFTIYAIEGISSADQPSSKKVAEILALIKAQQVKAIFPEKIENPKVLQEITRESGAVLGGELYADGLGEGDAATYEGMYRHNVSTIVDALK